MSASRRRRSASRSPGSAATTSAVTGADIDRFDYILGMDRGHVAELRWMATRSTMDRVQLLTAFAPQIGVVDIGDPYRGTRADYERALDLIEAGCRGLLRALLPYVKKAI